MKYPKRIISGVLLIAVLPLMAQTNRPKPKEQRAPTPNTARQSNADRGQLVFEQNCSRCHNAPEGFSSSISGTIAMHMRTRANLSEADYKALRRFFNP
ncbi:MAG TPA: cytochrome c [Candidatus Angelobacter sp.]|nr:cytochrome c [Candidatus Angelobacter sp.]